MTVRYAEGIVKDPATDAYVAKLKGPARADAERLLALVRDEVPTAIEAIRWNNPFFFVDEVAAVFLMTFDRSVHLGLADGATLPDPDGIVTGTGRALRHVKLASGATDAQLRKYIRAAAKQARALAKELPLGGSNKKAKRKKGARQKPATRSTAKR